jgi:hypothetical protein
VILGDLPVLAVQAMKVASRTAERVDCCSRKKMIEGLLLDRVHGFGDDLSVIFRVKGSPAINPHPADSAFAFIDPAPVTAQPALYCVFFEFIKQFCDMRHVKSPDSW